MWSIYAVLASVCWGVSYAASGPVLKKGLSPLVFFFGYSLFGLLGSLLCLILSGKFSSAMRLENLERADAGWFSLSIAIGAVGACLTYVAMGARNPTLTALIEISYPFFVILFTWLFFREVQVNAVTLCGGLLILAGVAVVVVGEH